jgi:ribonuclease HI
MSKKKPKFYVVWAGVRPGIYTTWEQCQAQVHGYPAAKFKSYESKVEAENAYKEGADLHYGNGASNGVSKSSSSTDPKVKQHVIWASWSVDAACSGNPGSMEYQGVDTKTGKQLFHVGPMREGTNNIGEFLALVHALALLEKQGQPDLPIYSDSITAQGWIRGRKCKTTLVENTRNEPVFDLIRRAEAWLSTHHVKNPILKWQTKSWGEIPADFGRK